MKRKRILLMYISEVSGHHQATIAIENAIKELSPDSQIRNINGFKHVAPITEKIVNNAYLGVIKKTPRVWDYLYDNPKFVRRTQALKKIIHRSNHAKLLKLYNEFQPDVVVCTQAFPCGLWADCKTRHDLPLRLIGVLTDYAPHRFWLDDGVDYYIVPSQESVDRFIQHGIAEDRIKLFGIPVDKKFLSAVDVPQVVRQLGFDPAVPIVLVMGGGQGLGPIKEMVTSLCTADVAIQMVVVAGTNKKLLKWLQKFCARSTQKIVVYEYAQNIEELMTVAKLAITKPGGMTTTEALVTGLPMVIVNPLPGQEAHNTDFLLRHGAAIRIDTLDDIGRQVEALLCSPQRLDAMRCAARAQSRPHSSRDIAQLVLQ